jgi:rare lipoprotein A
MNKIAQLFLPLTTFLWFTNFVNAQVVNPTDSITKVSIQNFIEPIDTLIVNSVYKENAHASYYSDKLNGRRTASGKRFNNNEYTAAHKKLKFGTKVKVTNLKNGKWVVVTITDRGPFTKGYEIDLTKKAFREIAHTKGTGSLRVKIELL